MMLDLSLWIINTAAQVGSRVHMWSHGIQIDSQVTPAAQRMKGNDSFTSKSICFVQKVQNLKKKKKKNFLFVFLRLIKCPDFVLPFCFSSLLVLHFTFKVRQSSVCVSASCSRKIGPPFLIILRQRGQVELKKICFTGRTEFWREKMAVIPKRARADYDYLIKLLLIGDSGKSISTS